MTPVTLSAPSGPVHALLCDRFADRLRGLLEFLLPLYDDEGKPYLTVGIGCTGGRHRSVAMLDALAGELRAMGRDVNVTHRDVEKV